MYNIIFYSGYTPAEKFIMCCMFALAAMIAIICHEFAHGFIALKNGDDTAKLAGRLTFNPAKHFDVMGVVLFALVGIGWANPVPVNPNNFNKPRRGMFTVAIAGIVTNFILAVIAFIIFCLLGGIFQAEYVDGSASYYLAFLVYSFLVYTIVINLCLIAFNILPIFPLDGFRVVEAFTKPDNKYRVFMYKYGVYILLGLFVLDIILSNFGYGPLTLYIQFVQNSTLKLFNLVRGLFV